MNIGIVGHEAAKFTTETEERARALIREYLSQPGAVLVSGHCHLGGVDIFAEEVATVMSVPTIIHAPKVLRWGYDGEYGFKARNLDIARDSDVLYCLSVKEYPESYKGMRFDYCYHCGTDTHKKGGGCWTAKQASKMGKKVFIVEI